MSQKCYSEIFWSIKDLKKNSEITVLRTLNKVNN